MVVKDIVKFLDEWAPPGAAWERDNVGLQAGSLKAKVTNIMISLDCTLPVLEEAIKRKCSLVISHHPLIFSPLKKINTDSDEISRILSFALKNDLTLLAYHTNLDFTLGGVNTALADLLELKNTRFLEPSPDVKQFKLAVFVPDTALEKVSSALFSAGAGVIGEYSECSFSSQGTGTFFGSENANPALGEKGRRESVTEHRLEVLLYEWQLKDAIIALKTAHPYEEPAYDIYPVKTNTKAYGFGIIGDLPAPAIHDAFLEMVADRINPFFTYTKGNKKFISRVAVCGGSASELLPKAIAAGADAFITADVRYHAFHDAGDKIMLISAGHYETEAPVLPYIKKRIEGFTASQENEIQTFIYSGTTNPVNYFYKSTEYLH
ncbi:MAG: GTP cyclohydrolase 1 type 2 [Ignavibacteriaceae bacterium]|nr:GTP cyclohydrolase 1 type 2 [Ignavibacteriaceae bacterium]